jgi:hypothetical protein
MYSFTLTYYQFLWGALYEINNCQRRDVTNTFLQVFFHDERGISCLWISFMNIYLALLDSHYSKWSNKESCGNSYILVIIDTSNNQSLYCVYSSLCCFVYLYTYTKYHFECVIKVASVMNLCVKIT